MDDERQASVEERRREEINEIGRAVKVARNGRGWSLRRLADEAGLSASLISAVETGKIVPTVGSLFAISDALDQPAETFFPFRRRSSASGPGVIAEVPPDSGDDQQEPETHPEAPDLPPRRRSERDASTASVHRPKDVERTTPRPRQAISIGRATPIEDPLLESARPTRRSIVRPARVVSRRAASSPSAGVTSGDPRRADGSVVTPDSPASRFPEIASRGPDLSDELPGVTVRRVGQRPTVLIERGIVWSLPVDVPGGIGSLIEVSIPPGVPNLPTHRISERSMTLLVTRGRLRIEAAFARTTLEVGDSVVVAAGVPHRLTSDAPHPATYLTFVVGEWDGTL